MKRRPLPPDGGLGKPVRRFDETFSGEELFLREFERVGARHGAPCSCCGSPDLMGKERAMADIKGDPAKQPVECTVNSNNRCPNLAETGGGMSGEQYECKVCGERFYLDYDDMR